MKINYTYDDDNRPIKKVNFFATAGVPVSIDLEYIQQREVFGKENCVLTLNVHGMNASFNKEDFADFTILINRINKQLGN